MREMMVRKQIYLPRRQNQLLKRLAKQRGISEAEVVRQALEREAEMNASAVRDSRKALEEIFAFVETLRKRPEVMRGKPLKFDRTEIYAERESRWIGPKEGK